MLFYTLQQQQQQQKIAFQYIQNQTNNLYAMRVVSQPIIN
jgi:hypothetical protein